MKYLALLLSIFYFQTYSAEVGCGGNDVRTNRIVVNGQNFLIDKNDFEINLDSVGRLNLSSNDANATQRTVKFTAPSAEGIVIIVFDGSGGMRILDNTPIPGAGIVDLKGNFTVNSNRATLMMIYDGTNLNELTRSIN